MTYIVEVLATGGWRQHGPEFLSFGHALAYKLELSPLWTAQVVEVTTVRKVVG